MWYICIARGYYVASNVLLHEMSAPIQCSAARGVTTRDAQLLHIGAALASPRYTHQYCITVSTLSETSSSERLPQRPNPGFFYMIMIHKVSENRFCGRWLPDPSIAYSPRFGGNVVLPQPYRSVSFRFRPCTAVSIRHRTKP